MQLQEQNSLPAFLLQRFELIRSLGDGGFAEVFMVADRNNDNKIFALKVLKASKLDHKNLERLEKEFQILSQINSEHIVKAYELIKAEDNLAILMQAVEGQSLYELINERKLSLSEIEHIFNCILEALQILHESDIAHRDLKLENILIDKSGNAKISDLGFLKRTDSFEKEDLDQLLGTVQYLAPEYIKHGHYDYKSDLYSVALMLFECLTGRRWLAGKTAEQSLNYLYEINFEFPKLALSGLPVKFLQVLERGLAMQPWKRFDSARSMRLAILSENGSEKPFTSVKLKESVNIKDVSARRKTQEFLSLKKKRNDQVVFTCLVILLIFVCLAIVYFIFKDNKIPPENQNKQQSITDSNIEPVNNDNSIFNSELPDTLTAEINNQDMNGPIDLNQNEQTGKDDDFVNFDDSAMIQ